MKKPIFTHEVLPSGSGLIRFNDAEDMFYYDVKDNNPRGIGWAWHSDSMGQISSYLLDRWTLTPEKLQIIDEAQKELQMDKDFIELVYKAKSEKRNYTKSKFGGNLNIPRFASQQEKVFDRLTPGAKKITVDMAFQVGTFQGGNYRESFKNILKTILMAQALGINLNIDVFDSDYRGYNIGDGYIICNIAKAEEKLNMRKILVASHSEFFNFSLFNGYAASGLPYSIQGFLSTTQIREDLGPMYDVIGGNMQDVANNQEGKKELVSKLLKIGWKR